MKEIKQQKVANELLANGGSIASAMRKAGYSSKTARTPKKMLDSKKYKEAVAPIIQKIEKERDRLIDALSQKNLSKEKYRDMVDGIDKLTKNAQLLNGGKTSNEGIQISWE